MEWSVWYSTGLYCTFIEMELPTCKHQKCHTGPGVDVMITIFKIFLRKNWRFFSRINVMIKILHTYIILLCFESKTQFFRQFFGGENISKMSHRSCGSCKVVIASARRTEDPGSDPARV
jgi:hypothetical protein